MATGQGTATLNFGALPGAFETSVAVTGQATISGTSKVEAYVMADDTTADHTAVDHRYFAMFANLTCGTPSAGTGFTIYARAREQLVGQWALRWVWAD